MFFVVLFILLLLPVLELWAIVEVSHILTFFPTLIVLILLSVFGVASLKFQSLKAWQTTMRQSAAGKSPTTAMLNGALGVLGSVLFIIPGFITAALGAIMLFPPTRALLRPILAATILARVQRAASRSRFGTVIIGGMDPPGGHRGAGPAGHEDILDVEGWDVPGDPDNQQMLGRGDDPNRNN